MTVREQTEMIEVSTLNEKAALAMKSKGRAITEEECPLRTVYQRDRDRILHSRAFRRLKHKTQVFISPAKDHYRTRLTHTLEVSQIARTIARALRLNEDLTEAIALGHDLGHTPFGHAGERVLNKICPHGFRHNIQSVRVVEYLEKEGKGLNLTYEVLDGIRKHVQGGTDTLEGDIVEIADKIAFINHDIEDAVRAGIISAKDLPYNSNYFLGESKSQRITTMVTSLTMNSKDTIKMHPEIEKAHKELLNFMFNKVYFNSAAKEEEHKVERLIKNVYDFFIENPDDLPEFYKTISKDQDVPRAVCDYIAGMSDLYLVQVHNDIFIPRSWEL